MLPATIRETSVGSRATTAYGAESWGTDPLAAGVEGRG